MHDTRTGVIWRHVDMALNNDGRLTQEGFAAAAVEHYCRRTPAHLRSIEFHQHQRGGDPYKVMRLNAQLLFRMRPDGPTRMPVEIEEAVVLALPPTYRAECLRDLSQRYGLLAAEIPAAAHDSAAAHLRSPCELMRKAAAAVERIAPMLEDGKVTADDAEHFPVALAAINDVQGACVTLVAQIAAAMGPAGEPVRSSPIAALCERVTRAEAARAAAQDKLAAPASKKHKRGGK